MFPHKFVKIRKLGQEAKKRVMKGQGREGNICPQIPQFWKTPFASRMLVCYTAVFSVIMQRSSRLTAAENRTTFLSLCVCGLTNKPIMYKKLDNTWAAGRQERTRFSVFDKSINRRWILMGSVSASNEKVVCRKVCFKRLTKFQVKKKRFDRPTRLLPGSVGSF